MAAAAELRVRRMVESDLDRVVEIERDSFPTPWTREHFLVELRAHRYAFDVVLEQRRRLIGYACCWIVDDELRINNIAIAPEQRGRGLGTRLLRWVLLAAVSRGCREATLEVRPGNHAAVSLYRRHGFVETGRRKGYYADTGEDALLMAARLDRCPEPGGGV